MRLGFEPGTEEHPSRAVPSGPNSVPKIVDVSTHELRHHAFGGVAALARSRPLQADPGEMLLRKEVIQPHLPVRLPCYDFVPIASPTFDHSLRKRLGHGLRVLPTFVT